MKRIKRLLNDIKGYLPVSRRELGKVIANVVTVMDGFDTITTTQAQVYTGIIKELEKLKKPEKDTKPVEGVKGYQ